MEKIFYVYMFLDPLRGDEPFYVGKGKGKRAWAHTGNSHTDNRIRGIRAAGFRHTVRVVRDGLSETTALKVEAFLILKLGRADLGTGSLTNWHGSGADARILNKTHHSLACSKAQTARFSSKLERDLASKKTEQWVFDHPQEHKALVTRRNTTLRTGKMRKQISESLLRMYVDSPEVKEKQRKSKELTQKSTNYYAKISRSLGGLPLEVTTEKETRRFDSQHQAAKFLGCYPARVNAALHKRGGRFSESISVRFVLD